MNYQTISNNKRKPHSGNAVLLKKETLLIRGPCGRCLSNGQYAENTFLNVQQYSDLDGLYQLTIGAEINTSEMSKNVFKNNFFVKKILFTF